jgi:hypothetical protein
VGKEKSVRPRVSLFSLPIKDRKSIPIRVVYDTIIKHLLDRTLKGVHKCKKLKGIRRKDHNRAQKISAIYEVTCLKPPFTPR